MNIAKHICVIAIGLWCGPLFAATNAVDVDVTIDPKGDVIKPTPRPSDLQTQADKDAENMRRLGRLASEVTAIASQRMIVHVSLRPVVRPHGYGVKYTASWVNSRPSPRQDAQWKCLTEALYFEARGESIRGQFAVAEVILNRVDSRKFPNSICRVVNQGTGRKFACQFTYTCDDIPETIHNQRLYRRLGKIARVMMDGGARMLTGNATYYHTTAVNPSWGRKFYHTVTIGVHRFYRPSWRYSLS